MKLFVLCSDSGHPVMPRLRSWRETMIARGHEVNLCSSTSELTSGDILFLVSCSEILPKNIRRSFRHTLVLHASDLPRGRGWSPHIWQIIRGANQIHLCLLEAGDRVDTGDIWFKEAFRLEGHELLPEINDKLFALELELMTRAVDEADTVAPAAQVGEPGAYEVRRTAEDSRLDERKSIAEQFDLLRVVDNERYPAFFEYRGKRYAIKITKYEK
jgi:methionyl-tRNA formyltransferase